MFGAVRFLARRPWQPLPFGGEVRLAKVGFSRSADFRGPGLPLDTLRDWLGPEYSVVLGHKPETTNIPFHEPAFFVAFASRGGGYGLTGAFCHIDLPDGQTLQGWGGHFGKFAGQSIDAPTFEIAPLSQRRLHVRLEFAQKTLHFDVENPAFVTKRAEWKAAPLPQTRKVDDLEITLERVVASNSADQSEASSWVANAEYSIRIRDQNVASWVTYSSTFCDPVGNESKHAALFSEPVWKVRLVGIKKDDFPQLDSTVQWLGTGVLPGPGESRILVYDHPTPTSQQRLLAWVGPGHYRIVSGKITPVAIPNGVEVVQPIRSYNSHKPSALSTAEAITDIDTPEVALLNIDDRAQRGELFLRDNAGQRHSLDQLANYEETSLSRPLLPAGTSEAEVGFIRIQQFETEFYITPPSPPVRSK